MTVRSSETWEGILIGYTAAQNAGSDEQRATWSTKPTWAGVENSDETLEWLFNHHFAAHAGDTLAFEQFRKHKKGVKSALAPLTFFFICSCTRRQEVASRNTHRRLGLPYRYVAILWG
jgi:hypothetical protein